MKNSECFRRNDFGVVTSCRWFGGFVDVKIRHHVHTEVFHGNFFGTKCRVHSRMAYFDVTSVSKILDVLTSDTSGGVSILYFEGVDG